MVEFRIEGTWINLPEPVINEANQKANAIGASIGDLISEAVRAYQPDMEITDGAGDVCPTCKRPGVHCNGC